MNWKNGCSLTQIHSLVPNVASESSFPSTNAKSSLRIAVTPQKEATKLDKSGCLIVGATTTRCAFSAPRTANPSLYTLLIGLYKDIFLKSYINGLPIDDSVVKDMKSRWTGNAMKKFTNTGLCYLTTKKAIPLKAMERILDRGVKTTFSRHKREFGTVAWPLVFLIQ